MRGSWKLTEKGLLEPIFQPGVREIHVLVALPPGRVPELCATLPQGALADVGRPRSYDQAHGEGEGGHSEEESPAKRRAFLATWHTEPRPCPQLPIKEEELLLCIPHHYVSHLGIVLPKSATDLWLYRRLPLREQWNEIDRDCIDAHAWLSIVGAPGSGKSCAAYAFACGKLDRQEWNVLWLHSPPFVYVKRLRVVKFEGDVKSTCTLPFKSLEHTIESVLTSFSSTRKLIVFFDGFVKDDATCQEAFSRLVDWHMDDPTNRRLVNVTSMVSFGKDHKPSKYETFETPITKPSRQTVGLGLQEVMMFTLASWTLTEYKAAIRHDEFFQSVERALRPTERCAQPLPDYIPIEKREELIADKYFVAGGSARMMFINNTPTAKQDISIAITAISNSYAQLQGGDHFASSGTVNRLVAIYDVGGSVSSFESAIVSSYAARSLALCVGPDFIINFARSFSANPAIDGHLLEAWVIASLAFHDFEYEERGRAPTPMKTSWKRRPALFFDTKQPLDVVASQYSIPTQWNQASYDVVYTDTYEAAAKLSVVTHATVGCTVLRHRVIFLQVTRGRTHSYDSQPFYELLHLLGDSKALVGSVELWYAVPRTKLDEFTVPTDECDFARGVVEVAFPETRRQMTHRVRVVGVNYPINEQSPTPGATMLDLPLPIDRVSSSV